MSQRECGPCDLCCTGSLIADINGEKLSPGTGCSKLTDRGCGIYETRPEHPCRTFICTWLQAGSPLSEELRPDKSGAIVMMDRPWKGWKTIRAVPTSGTIPEATLAVLMKLAQETNTPLIYYVDTMDGDVFLGRKAVGFGPPDFVKAVKLNVNQSDITMSVQNL